MSDLEMTKACAEAMGYSVLGEYPDLQSYDPIHDDAEAMALVKHCRLDLRW